MGSLVTCTYQTASHHTATYSQPQQGLLLAQLGGGLHMIQSEMSVLSYARSYNKQKGETGVILVGRLELRDTAMG